MDKDSLANASQSDERKSAFEEVTKAFVEFSSEKRSPQANAALEKCISLINLLEYNPDADAATRALTQYKASRYMILKEINTQMQLAVGPSSQPGIEKDLMTFHQLDGSLRNLEKAIKNDTKHGVKQYKRDLAWDVFGGLLLLSTALPQTHMLAAYLPHICLALVLVFAVFDLGPKLIHLLHKIKDDNPKDIMGHVKAIAKSLWSDKQLSAEIIMATTGLVVAILPLAFPAAVAFGAVALIGGTVVVGLAMTMTIGMLGKHFANRKIALGATKTVINSICPAESSQALSVFQPSLLNATGKADASVRAAASAKNSNAAPPHPWAAMLKAKEDGDHVSLSQNNNPHHATPSDARHPNDSATAPSQSTTGTRNPSQVAPSPSDRQPKHSRNENVLAKAKQASQKRKTGTPDKPDGSSRASNP